MAIIAILPEEKKNKQFPLAENQASDVHEVSLASAIYPPAKSDP